MPASLWLHEVAETDHRILDPFSDAKLLTVGAILGVTETARVLDLACGKGELLCRWAQEYGSAGHGVDISETFLAAAADRAAQLGVADRVTFSRGEAAQYVAMHGAEASYDVVSCIGATWIGGGFVGTIELLRRQVKPGGLLAIGEPYWIDPPPAEAYDALDFSPDDFTSLVGTLDRCIEAGADLVEMVLADGDDWDRYEAAQWWALTRWLDDNPGDDRASEVRAFRDRGRRTHLAFQRRYLGWGVFVLRP